MQSVVTLAAAVSLLLLSACSTLKVQVDVADPVAVEVAVANAASRRQLSAYVAESEADLRRDAEQLRDRTDAALEGVARAYDRLAAELASDPATRAASQRARSQAASYRADDHSARRLIHGHIQRYVDEASDLNNQLRFAYALAGDSDRFYASGEVAALISRRISLDQSLRATITGQIAFIADTFDEPASSSEVRLAGGSAAASARAAIDEAEDELNADLRSILQGASLVGSGYAYAVRSLDDDYWRPQFNRAFAGAYFGSSDIVIRLNSTGDFSVKGVTFDPSAVADAASKVAGQSLILLPQILGAPVLQEGSDPSTILSAAAAVDQQRNALARGRALDQARDAATIELAFAILSEQRAIESADYADATAPILSTFAALRPRLELAPIDTGGD